MDDDPIFETSRLEYKITVYKDKIVYNPGKSFLFNKPKSQTIPISQIASVELGSFGLHQVFIKTTGGSKHDLVIESGEQINFQKVIHSLQYPERNELKKEQEIIPSEKKICPFCAEEIMADAKKCRYCKEFLDKEKNEIKPESQEIQQIGDIFDPGRDSVKDNLDIELIKDEQAEDHSETIVSEEISLTKITQATYKKKTKKKNRDYSKVADEIIKSITPSVPIRNYFIDSGPNCDGLNDICEYDPIRLDKESKRKIFELEEISNNIDSKLIKESDNDFKTENHYKIKYADELNKQQLWAVSEINCPLLVIAGAGSGKTRVITYKVSYLIENGINPHEILLLTFTRKAANVMLDRVQTLLADKTAGGVLGGTFHSFANNVLRKYGKIVNIPSNFTIVDTEDAEDIIDLIKTELDLRGKKNGRAFPRKKTIQEIISKSRNLELSISKIIKKYYDDNVDFIEEIKIISDAFAKYKRTSNVFDFDDLMEELRNNLRENETFRRKIQDNIKYVLVDEYQDTNNVQREIIELIVGDSGKITVVGDDSQSIYSFRGANFENILRFPQKYPDCKIAKIEENYRSEQGILNFTNEIILNAKIGFKKKLHSSRYTGKKPIIRRFPDETEEAKYIANKLLEIKGNDLEYSDFAVLTRAGWHSNYIQTEFSMRGIPYVVMGGIKFSERRHVKDIIAFLKIILNPLDTIAWHRILRLVEGIGKVRAVEITEIIRSNNGLIKFDRFSNKRFYHDLCEYEKLYKGIIGEKISLQQTIKKVYEFYKPILKLIKDDYNIRIRDLDAFLVIAGKYNDLEKFLADFTLEPPTRRYQDDGYSISKNDEKPVVVSTIHSAKGLEWHTVFIPFALDGLIPSYKSFKSMRELEEERRLFYVAASRSKENLFITMPTFLRSWDAIFTKSSRFLAEIDKNCYEIDK
jgi:DNA helicase-2/ATP-dependent DNA helicase PcrA